jgi:hypothetical protein
MFQDPQVMSETTHGTTHWMNTVFSCIYSQYSVYLLEEGVTPVLGRKKQDSTKVHHTAQSRGQLEAYRLA